MSQYFKTPETPAQPVARGPQRSGLAVASMITGLLSIVIFCLSFPLAAVSLVTGTIALVMIAKSPATRKGKGFAITGIVCSILSVATSIGLAVWAKNHPDAAGDSGGSTPRTALQRAEENIRIKRGDEVAFGNSPEAKALAAKMSEQFKLMRETFFTESRSKMSLSDGEFLTHCELHAGSCAFLVHVPSLRKFDDDAKKSLSDIAWMLAQSVLGETDFPEGGRIAVGVKGVLLYDDIRTGKHVKNNEDDEAAGLEASKELQSALDEFFPEPAVDSPETTSSISSPEQPDETTSPAAEPSPTQAQ